MRGSTWFEWTRFVVSLIGMFMLLVRRLASGIMYNIVQELRVLKSFGVGCNPRRPRIVEVNWHPPPFGWVKINTNGAWSGLGVGGYGAIFRDDKVVFMGAFFSSLDIPSSVAADVMAVIKAIELTWVRD